MSPITLTSIERLVYVTSGYTSLTFADVQVGPGLSAALSVTGSSNIDLMAFQMGASTALDLSAFTFANWSSSFDVVQITGDNDAETLIGSRVNDTVSGGGGGDVLWSSYGADGFDDTLAGGDGSDIYFVYETSDFVAEANANAATGGLDLVYSFSNRTLSANVEYLTLFGNNAGLTAVGGNSLDNALNAMQYTGGSGINFTDDLGNDIVFASYYADTISTGLGNDTLWGSWGADGAADAMTGGDGADTYYVQEALDTVTETNTGTGPTEIDTVYSAIDMTLGANLEYLFIYGNATLAAGNSLDNALIGSYWVCSSPSTAWVEPTTSLAAPATTPSTAAPASTT